MFVAAQEGHAQVVDLLLASKADAETSLQYEEGEGGLGALEIAIKRGHVDAVKAFLAHRPDLKDSRTTDDVSMLAVAVDASYADIAGAELYADIAGILLSNGADPSLKNMDGIPILFDLIEHGQRDMCEALIPYLKDLDAKAPSQSTALHVAASAAKADVVAMLLQAKVSVTETAEDGSQAIHLAVHAGSTEIADMLLEAKADVNSLLKNKVSALFLACQERHVELAQHLLTMKADPNLADADGGTCLLVCTQPGIETAEQRDVLPLVEALLLNKADVAQAMPSGTTPLHVACQRTFDGQDKVVAALLEAKAPTDAVLNTQGVTPLFLAAQEGHAAVVTQLVEHKAEINITNNEGASPLFIAVQECKEGSSHRDCVAALLAGKADANETVEELSVLFMAVRHAQVELTELLLQSKADVNWMSEGNDNATSIAFAFCPDNKPMMAALRAAGGAHEALQMDLKRGVIKAMGGQSQAAQERIAAMRLQRFFINCRRARKRRETKERLEAFKMSTAS